MKVDTQHDEYINNLKIWQRIKDCVEGQDAIKRKMTTYLPKLNGMDIDSYDKYLQRAQFTNFTGRTLNISLGQVFRKNPIVQNVDETLLDDIDLSGQTFYYFSREVLQEIAETNRCGILVEWSEKQGRPYLVKYEAESIINWRKTKVNGQTTLFLVVLEGFMEVDKEDIFDVEKEKIWIVLWLEEGVYTISKYKRSKDGLREFVNIEEDIKPKKNGNYFDYIPFYFCTAQGLSDKIKKPVLYDFVNVNLGHYINSADLENMLHWTGAKTLVTIGYNSKDDVPVGGSFNLPVGGNAMYLEASSDSGLKEEMIKKAENMAVMGAALISGQGRYIASAETSRINSQGEYASLADLSKSLSNCMTQILKEMIEWQGGDIKDVSVKYNVDFELAEVDPATLTAFMGAVQSGYMSWETFYYNMKNKELYPPEWTIEDEKKAIDEEKQKNMEEIELNQSASGNMPDEFYQNQLNQNEEAKNAMR